MNKSWITRRRAARHISAESSAKLGLRGELGGEIAQGVQETRERAKFITSLSCGILNPQFSPGPPTEVEARGTFDLKIKLASRQRRIEVARRER